MKRFLKSTLALSLLALAGQTFAATTTTTTTSNVSPAERAKIEEVVHQYLLSKPEVLVQAMQVLQQKQYQEAEKTVKQTQQTAGTFATPLFHAANDPVVGNANGKITVVEFFDYQCPHCVDMAPVMAGIIKANPDVRVIYKEFPIRGPMSDFASRAALAANMQGKYLELSHAILTSGQPLTQDAILKMAKDQGIDVDKLKKDMNGPTVDAQLKANIKLAQDLKLFGTPALFIGKTDTSNPGSVNYVPGQMSQAQLQDAINKAAK